MLKLATIILNKNNTSGSVQYINTSNLYRELVQFSTEIIIYFHTSVYIPIPCRILNMPLLE